MDATGTACRIPLPLPVAPNADAGQASQLVADFLSATHALSCEATAELAGVRTETIRKWRRCLPRAVRATTSRRMKSHLAGTPDPASEEDLQRLFRRVLRTGGRLARS